LLPPWPVRLVGRTGELSAAQRQPRLATGAEPVPGFLERNVVVHVVEAGGRL
jgi:hypothetical protein